MAPPPAHRRVLDAPDLRAVRHELEASAREFARAEARRSEAVARRRAAVDAARAAGAGWQEIADVLGLSSRQAAEEIAHRGGATRRARRGDHVG